MADEDISNAAQTSRNLDVASTSSIDLVALNNKVENVFSLLPKSEIVKW